MDTYGSTRARPCPQIGGRVPRTLAQGQGPWDSWAGLGRGRLGNKPNIGHVSLGPGGAKVAAIGPPIGPEAVVATYLSRGSQAAVDSPSPPHTLRTGGDRWSGGSLSRQCHYSALWEIMSCCGVRKV